MRRFRAWIEDIVGAAVAEVENLSARGAPPDATSWSRLQNESVGAATRDLMLDPGDSLTIRRPVRAGARFYVAAIGRSIVETSWPFASETPVWTATLARGAHGWDIVVHMLRPELLAAIRQSAGRSQQAVRTLWLNGGEGPTLDLRTERDAGRKTGRLRLALWIAFCAVCIAAPLADAASALRAMKEMNELAARARSEAAPVRADLRAQRSAAAAQSALNAALARPSLADHLYDLASTLPATARLTSVAISGEGVRLDGQAPAATAVLAAFADAADLDDVRFDGAVNAIPSGGERFSIIAKRVVGKVNAE